MRVTFAGTAETPLKPSMDSAPQPPGPHALAEILYPCLSSVELVLRTAVFGAAISNKRDSNRYLSDTTAVKEVTF